MAILPEHPGLEVKICVRGQQLHEYDDDDKDAAPNTITKYIEARSGKEFSIVAEYRPPFPDHHDVLARVLEEADKTAPDIVALEQILSIKGCITISLNFVKITQEMSIDELSYSDDIHQQLAALQEIPEKALKGDALSHQAVYVKSG
ncbi:hypothetical protein J4E86_001766 [Alternaria arbusti]|uniref:uncharacterized protein n=1 Tax=Alternaria arbusti TaxID=232088 RepID=UPI00221FE4AC|nr:uncharacterized protein J4E86_001766 [Alternaria arbusti]KAI4960146.1 hypothetical protein J4E86_001766 [Alternaria arbusti]